MNCCQCHGIEQQFDQTYIASRLKAYRKNGPETSTRILTAQLIAQGIAGTTLLDIGGGVGAIQHALLEAGAISVIGVDASRASIEAARQEATRRGFGERVQYQFGDFVTLSPNIPPADIVTLDRVICCYHDMPGLVQASAARAKRLYALVYPHDSWWIRMGTRMINSVFALQQNSFRIFCHRTEAVERLIVEQGFERIFHTGIGVWQAVIFHRTNTV